jgi:hypothetical protein
MSSLIYIFINDYVLEKGKAFKNLLKLIVIYFINFLNTVKQTVSILPDMPESDIKNEQDMIYHQLDSMYQTVINKMKSEPVV